MNIMSRIQRAEAAIAPAPGAVVFREPAPDATAEAREIFEQEMTSALKGGATVIVRHNGVDRLRRPGILYVENDFEASLTSFAHTPAMDGKSSNKLSQVIAAICAAGSTLPVVREVSDG